MLIFFPLQFDTISYSLVFKLIQTSSLNVEMQINLINLYNKMI